MAQMLIELTLAQGLLYLLRKSYSMIYFMMTSSEPVSEALLPIYNQLMTLKKCLKEVKRSGGVSTPRELYPYSMKVCRSNPYLALSHVPPDTQDCTNQTASS